MVSHPDHVIRLDTGAFRAPARHVPPAALAYWVVLAVGAAGVAVGIASSPATTVGAPADAC